MCQKDMTIMYYILVIIQKQCKLLFVRPSTGAIQDNNILAIIKKT